ncbi:MAG: hypothetical protein OHK93_004391 [Ramalina farinacea]|uniref:CREG-like beta-barrel domain-containing protein n=1 Tax=Ramalina farinacea TaxID=258253 RepID=A0AA43QVS8_9LECA|nr:hypothetical protein [Ramalina farinacea]
MVRVLTAFSLLSCAFSASPPNSRYLFSNPTLSTDYHIPTIHESAVLARRMLNLSSIGTLSTVFPSTAKKTIVKDEHPCTDSLSAIPDDIGGFPIGLMEYFAACDPDPSNPTILAISIATYIRNARQGSNVSLTIRWQPPADAPPTDDPYLYSPANLPRFSLQGYIEAIPQDEVEAYKVKQCFLDRHGEVIWTPGSGIHESWWGRIVVEGVYWFGGFGDRARIGWIPIEEWKGVTDAEISNARLAGEKGFVPPALMKQDVKDSEL